MVAKKEEAQVVAPVEVAPYDPWTDMREVELPPVPRGEDQYLIIGINGKHTRVKRGVKVTVPYPVYERINIIRDAEQKEYDYLKSIDDTNTNISTGEKDVIRR